MPFDQSRYLIPAALNYGEQKALIYSRTLLHFSKSIKRHTSYNDEKLLLAKKNYQNYNPFHRVVKPSSVK